ncbi:MAG TPA: TauD/TfdA family dioxygenase [Alphaproteobacteria bacterium]|nr:TauD/TfdA family dioxygenase [Alphaproteobacteria bacterium]
MPIAVMPSGASLGARVAGLDLAAPLEDSGFREVEAIFHRHQVVAFEGQHLDEDALIAFARRFGELEHNVASSFHHPRTADLTVLSNIVRDGKPYGSPDAGQGWHTDMSYNSVPARASILYALQVPMKDGRALGDTLFSSMYAAYDALSEDWKTRLEGLRAEHDFEKFYTYMIQEKGSPRPPLTDAQRRQKPAVVHPIVLRHPWTGRKCLYADPGYTVRIRGIPAAESDEILSFLFDHQTQERFQYRHSWRVGDVLIWDNCATIHMATGGYDASTPRLMHRAQVLGDDRLYRQKNAA